MTAGVQGDRLLLTRTQAFSALRMLSGPTLIALAIGTVIVVVDGATPRSVNLMPLLAIAPVVAAFSASPRETGVVGAFSVVMALLSGFWHGFATGSYLVALAVVGSGALAAYSAAALRERLERRQKAEALLAEVGTLLATELDQASRAKHVAELAVPTLADAASVYLLQEDGTIAHTAIASSSQELASVLQRLRHREPIEPASNNPVAIAVRTRREQFLGPVSEDELPAAADPGVSLSALRRAAPRETIVVPLQARGAMLGAIKLSLLDEVRHYDDDARRVVRALAERCALAIDNARVHEQQAHIASVLQRSLLPESLPEIAGFETATRFLAAGEANQVGGDFFDVFRSGRDSWTVVIGDVCGKGPEAAALTSLARHTIRAAESPNTEPSRVLARLHDSILDFNSEHRFCTAVLARVQRENASAALHLTIGGHPLPLALRAGGTVEPVGVPGSLLGGLDRPKLSDAVCEVRERDALILFTDGLLESRDRRNGPEPAWPIDALREVAGGSAEEIADRLLDAALSRQGDKPRDDIAIVVLRRLA